MQTEINYMGLKWLDISDPSQQEVKELGEKYSFHHLDLEDIFSSAQRAKIDEYPNYLFLLLYVPVLDTEKKHIKTLGLDIFLLDDTLITIHDNSPEIQYILDKISEEPLRKEEFLGRDTGFLLYKILDNLFDYSLSLLDKLNKTLNRVESDVFTYDFHQDNLKEILLLKKDVIHFRSIILPQRTVVAKLEHKFPSSLNVYFDDLVDKVETIWSLLETTKELLESVHETNETIISHNTNNVMKVLTVFSAVMLPLTLVTGFYGMNLQLPLAGQTHAALSLAAGMIVIVLVMLAYMKYKKWI